MKLIDKDALVAEIERRKQKLLDHIICESDKEWVVRTVHQFNRIIMFLDTLEVKDVGLNNEYIEEIYSHLDSIKDTADRMTSGNFMHNRAAIKFSANTIAKVLELIGLKAQKGEDA